LDRAPKAVNFINPEYITKTMATNIETIHREIIELKKDMTYIKDILSEKFELSDYAKKSLKQARETPESKYVDLT